MSHASVPAPSWPAYPHEDFPALQAEHLRSAQLYADRLDLIAALNLPPGPIIGEIGVAFGQFSEFLLRTVTPKTFIAFDTFQLHEIPVIWGRSTAEVFAGMTHRAYYEQQLAAWHQHLVVEEGFSHLTLARYPEQFFDLLYIDADHRYEAVQRDAALASTRMRRDGVLVFNDYIMFDHVNGTPYGVVPIVNQLVVNGGWQVIGLALHRHMFCDIALRKRTA